MNIFSIAVIVLLKYAANVSVRRANVLYSKTTAVTVFDQQNNMYFHLLQLKSVENSSKALICQWSHTLKHSL